MNKSLSILLVLLLVSTSVAATEIESPVSVAKIAVPEGALADNPGGLIHMRALDKAVEDSMPGFAVSARSMDVYVYETEVVGINVLGIRGDSGNAIDPEMVASYHVKDASVLAEMFQESHTINVMGEAMISSFNGFMNTTSIKDPVLQHTGISPGKPGSTDVQGEGTFSSKRVDGDYVYIEAQKGGEVLAHGDFTIELRGLACILSAPAEEEQITLDATVERTDPTGTGANNAVYDEVQRFVRIHAYDAELAMKISGADIELIQEGSELTFDAGATLIGLADSDENLSDETIEGGGSLDLRPGRGFLRAYPGDEEPQIEPLNGLATTFEVGAMPALLSALSVVLIAGTIAFVNRPTMSNLERSMDRANFSRAARVARKILKKTPREEAAMLSRAVALSRIGRNQDVQRELTKFLSQGTPSDGALHYVLGLSYLDEGNKDRARENMIEAVRRTPSLAAEVENRMGLLVETPREAHGYA